MRRPHTTLVCLMGKRWAAGAGLVSRVLEPLGADLTLLTEVADVKAAAPTLFLHARYVWTVRDSNSSWTNLMDQLEPQARLMMHATLNGTGRRRAALGVVEAPAQFVALEQYSCCCGSPCSVDWTTWTRRTRRTTASC